MEGVSAQRALPNTPLCKSRLRAANLGHRLVCQAGGQAVAKKLGRGEKVGRKAPTQKVSGLDAMETATAPSTLGLDIKYHGLHHVGLLCQNLEQSLEFYQGLLGLEINPDRPNKKLPYRGAWLWIGSEMIHLMELPNPDPLEDRPDHGGRDRHICIAVGNLEPLIESLDHANVKYTKSMSGRPAIFVRDPDMNCLECVEVSSLE